MKHILEANIIAQTELLRVIARLLFRLASSDKLYCGVDKGTVCSALREIDNKLQKACNEERTDE